MFSSLASSTRAAPPPLSSRLEGLVSSARRRRRSPPALLGRPAAVLGFSQADFVRSGGSRPRPTGAEESAAPAANHLSA